MCVCVCVVRGGSECVILNMQDIDQVSERDCK